MIVLKNQNPRNWCSTTYFSIKWKQNKQIKWWWCMRIVKTFVSWFFLKNWNSLELMFRDLFSHWTKKMKQVNCWLNVKILKSFLNNFRPVFPLKINKTGLIFLFLFLRNEGLSRVFWPIRLFNTRMKMMIYKQCVFQKFLIYQVLQNAF